MSQPIVILRHDADASDEDVESLKAAGMLVLRVSDPAAVSVLSAQSIVATDIVFRALLDMYGSMNKGYGDNDRNRVNLANSIVRYVNDALVARADAGEASNG